ncbi:hypothetical protein [Sphingobacterium hungaricum]
MTSISTDLKPRKRLEDKNNFQRFILINRDGTSVESIILSVPDIQLREEIISNHFLSRYVHWFVKEDIGANLIGRDNPWDFEWELSNSENLNIEITSIAENEEQFRKRKYEERLATNLYKEEITLHELEKITFNFPNEILNEKIAFYKSVGTKSDDFVANPYFNRKGLIFTSRIDEKVNELDNIIKQAVQKKLTKNIQTRKM